MQNQNLLCVFVAWRVFHVRILDLPKSNKQVWRSDSCCFEETEMLESFLHSSHFRFSEGSDIQVGPIEQNQRIAGAMKRLMTC